MSSTTTDRMTEYVTATIGGQLFGLPIERVQDVFAPQRVTRVPLAGYEVAGVLNMRGRIVTLIDLRRQSRQKAEGDDERELPHPIRRRKRCASERFGFSV